MEIIRTLKTGSKKKKNRPICWRCQIKTSGKNYLLERFFFEDSKLTISTLLNLNNNLAVDKYNFVILCLKQKSEPFQHSLIGLIFAKIREDHIIRNPILIVSSVKVVETDKCYLAKRKCRVGRILKKFEF